MSDEEARELGLEAARLSAIELAPTPADVAARADILSVHLALGPDTKGSSAETCSARLKPGAMFINTRAGEVVDHAALVAAVRERGLRVGARRLRQRAGGGDRRLHDELVALPGVYGTHHIGASTDQAQEAIAAETVRIVRSYKETGRGAERRQPREAHAGDAHARRAPPRPPGVLAHVFDHLRASEPQRPGDREHRLRGRRSRGGANQLDGAPAAGLCEGSRAATPMSSTCRS